MRRSFIVSVLAHLLLAAVVVGLSRRTLELPAPERAISVEIVSEAPPAPSPLPPKAPPAAAAPLPQRQAAAPAPPPPAPKVESRSAEPPKPAPTAEAKPPPRPEPVPPPEPAPAPPPAPKPAEAAKPEPPKPEPPKPEPPKPQPRKPAPEAEPPPDPVRAKPKGETRVETAKAAEPKPDAPKAPPAAKTQATDFDALLRSVEAQTRRVRAPDKREGQGTSAAEAGGTGQPGEARLARVDPSALVASISRQITPCWNIPIAAQGIGGLRAELSIALGPDGGVQAVAPTDAARMRSDPVFRAFAESAVRAVRACSPLKLPPESYQVWRNIIFNFDPSLLAG